MTLFKNTKPAICNDLNKIIKEFKKGIKEERRPMKTPLVRKKNLFTLLMILLALLILFGFTKIKPVRVTNLTIDKLWQYKTLSAIFSTPAIADINNDNVNDIIINSTDGKLYSIDGKKGERLFFFETGKPILSSPVILERSGKEKWIILAGKDGKVYTINKDNRCMWATIRQNLDSPVISTPVLSMINNDGIPDIIIAATDGKIYAFDGDRGWLIWKSGDTVGEFFSTPLPIKINNDEVADIIIGSPENKIYGIDGKTGLKIWERSVYGPVNSSPVYFNDKIIFIGDEKGILYKINIETGNALSQISLGAPIISTPAMINIQGKPLLTVPLKDGTIKAVNPKDLNITWEFDTKYQDPFLASPAVFDLNRDGAEDIVITSRNGYLYLINGKNGRNLMKPYFTGSSISSSPVLADINNDGFLDVVFGSESGYLFAFTIKTVPDKIIEQNKIVYGTFLNRKNENH